MPTYLFLLCYVFIAVQVLYLGAVREAYSLVVV